MFGVYASDVETLREVLNRPYRLLGAPFCGHLIYLARSIDESALKFLDQFGAAIDHETGEALAFIVLFDDATLPYSRDPWNKNKIGVSRSSYNSNYYSGWPRYRQESFSQSRHRNLPALDVPELVDGQFAFENAIAWRIRGGPVPKAASYRSSPNWSLKFADHLGLNRNFLPCIVAFDDPDSSEDGSCVVVPLQNPATAWNCIVNAISTFVARPETQTFIRASERFRKLDSDLKIATNRIALVERDLNELQNSRGQHRRLVEAERLSFDQVAHREGLVTSRRKFLRWMDSLPDDKRSFLIEVALIAQGDGEDVTALLDLLSPSAEIGAALQHFQACYQLRTLWLQEARFEGNPHIAAKIHDQLTAALLWLGRPADDIGRVLLMEATEREAFIDSLEAHAPVQRSEEQLAWNILTQTLGPYIKQSVVHRQIKDLQAQTERRISRLQQESVMLHQSIPDLRGRRLKAMTKLKSTKRSPFLPDLACSVERMTRDDRMPVRSDSSARAKIAKGATMTAEGTGFIASIIQILQGIGVLK